MFMLISLALIIFKQLLSTNFGQILQCKKKGRMSMFNALMRISEKGWFYKVIAAAVVWK